MPRRALFLQPQQLFRSALFFACLCLVSYQFQELFRLGDLFQTGQGSDLGNNLDFSRLNFNLLATATTSNKNIENPKKRKNQNHPSSNLVVDILSLGSLTRLDYLKAQEDTIARHKSVRHFFNATEQDDFDQACAANLTWEDVQAIAKFCKHEKQWDPVRQFVMNYERNSYASVQWLRQKKSPAGWMCAQSRPAQGLYKVMQQYDQMGNDDELLPDYLIVMDDDTFYNMDVFTRHFASMNSSDPLAMAGCMIRSPIRTINFTIPFGGYGFIMSRGSLKMMRENIHCDQRPELCRVIMEDSQLGEAPLFREGMSLIELIYKYAIDQPFTNVKEWKTGFCLHSDWLWGYISNFYNLSRHVDDAMYNDVRHSRLHAYMESELYAGNLNNPGRRICDYQNENCNSFTEACHYIKPNEMRAVTDRIRARVPDDFKQDDTEIQIADTDSRKPAFDPVVDILSLGFEHRMDFLEAQKSTFGSHASIRRFFHATEDDDAVQNCTLSMKLSPIDGKKFAGRCPRERQFVKSSSTLKKLLPIYLKRLEMSERVNMTSSVCGASRSIEGTRKVLEHYQASETPLPDFLLVIMDDTFYNMDIFLETMDRISEKSSISRSPMSFSGCLMYHEELAFSSPHVDYGLILNKEAIGNIAKPMHCNSNSDSDMQQRRFCQALQKNMFDERDLFEDGMSAIDLMVAIATRVSTDSSFSSRCIHGDWLWGHFLNEYGVIEALNGTHYESVPGLIEPLYGSIYDALMPVQKRQKLCRNRDWSQCYPQSAYCTGMSIDKMQEFWDHGKTLVS